MYDSLLRREIYTGEVERFAVGVVAVKAAVVGVRVTVGTVGAGWNVEMAAVVPTAGGRAMEVRRRLTGVWIGSCSGGDLARRADA